MFEKYCVMYSCIISTYLFIQMAAYCTPSEDTLGEAPPPSYVVQIGGLWFLESSLQRFKTTTLMTLITHPNTALVFLPSSPLFTNTWLGIVQSCFLLRCWYSECWKRNTVGEGPAELCLGSWQCRVEEEGPSLCPGRCLAMGRSQALFRSQLSYLPTV